MDALVAGWYRRAGVIPPAGSLAHALRHTYATLLVDAGASLPEVHAFSATPTESDYENVGWGSGLKWCSV